MSSSPSPDGVLEMGPTPQQEVGTPVPFSGVTPTSVQPTVLVINQRSPSYPVTAEQTGHQALLLIRHFTPHAVLISDDEYEAGALAGFDYTVVVGNDAVTPLPNALMEDVAARTGACLVDGVWAGTATNRHGQNVRLCCPL